MIFIIYLIMVLAGCQETAPTTVRAQSTPQEQSAPEPEPKRHRVEVGPSKPQDKTVDERLNLLEGQINWMKKRLKN